jgi:MFS family permease
MEPRLTDTQFIILETVHIAEERQDWTTFSAQSGDVADTLSLTMRAVVEAIAVDEQFARQIGYAQMSNQIAAGQFLKPQTGTYDRGGVSNIDAASGRITFGLTGSGLATQQINAQTLGERLAGKSLNDATAYLVNEIQQADGTLPSITVSPDWFGQMPLLPMRITIQLIEAPAMLLAGQLSDLVGRAALLAVGGIGAGLVMLGYLLLAGALATLLVVQVVRGVAFGSYTANAMTFAVEAGDERMRGTNSGLLNAVSGAGQLVGLYLGGTLVQLWGFQCMWTAFAITAALSAVCFLVLRKRK